MVPIIMVHIIMVVVNWPTDVLLLDNIIANVDYWLVSKSIIRSNNKV